MPDLTCAGDGLVGYQHSSILAQCITSNYKSCSCYYSSGIAASKWPTSLADKSTAFISSRSRIHPARKVKGTAHLAVRDGPREVVSCCGRDTAGKILRLACAMAHRGPISKALECCDGANAHQRRCCLSRTVDHFSSHTAGRGVQYLYF